MSIYCTVCLTKVDSVFHDISSIDMHLRDAVSFNFIGGAAIQGLGLISVLYSRDTSIQIDIRLDDSFQFMGTLSLWAVEHLSSFPRSLNMASAAYAVFDYPSARGFE